VAEELAVRPGLINHYFAVAEELVAEAFGAPLGVMAGARHRRPSRDLSQQPHGIGQALTPLQALQGLTVHPAWAAGEEGAAGQLAVGYRADLTVLADSQGRRRGSTRTR
jgi:cytosine/adenosine deaminase-related metal-dependent hydrolase